MSGAQEKIDRLTLKIDSLDLIIANARERGEKEEGLSLQQKQNNLIIERSQWVSLLSKEQQSVSKTVFISFEAIDALGKPAIIKKITFDKAHFPEFRAGYDIARLMQPDGTDVWGFERLENGGIYHAVRNFDAQKHRYQIDDEILEIEASQRLFQELSIDSDSVHLHQNLKIYEGNSEKVSSQFDAVVHGDVAEKTYAIVLEAKTKVHPTDLVSVLQRVGTFQKYLKSTSPLFCTSGFNPAAQREPFDHYKNVKNVIPCLAGKHFSNELIDACCSKGIIPVFPSGSRYILKMLHLIPKFIK